MEFPCLQPQRELLQSLSSSNATIIEPLSYTYWPTSRRKMYWRYWKLWMSLRIFEACSIRWSKKSTANRRIQIIVNPVDKLRTCTNTRKDCFIERLSELITHNFSGWSINPYKIVLLYVFMTWTVISCLIVQWINFWKNNIFQKCEDMLNSI